MLNAIDMMCACCYQRIVRPRHIELLGTGAVADSPHEVRLRAREQLRQGASQLKLMAGGGVASGYDDVDTTQNSEDGVTVV